MLSRSVRRSALRAAASAKAVKVPQRTLSALVALKPTQFVPVSAFSAPITPKRFASQSIKVPELAESITEGTLASFNKEVGEYVAQDEL